MKHLFSVLLVILVTFGCAKADNLSDQDEQAALKRTDDEFIHSFKAVSERFRRYSMSAIATGQIVFPIERVCELNAQVLAEGDPHYNDLRLIDILNDDRRAQLVNSSQAEVQQLYKNYKLAVARTLFSVIDIPIQKRAEITLPDEWCLLSGSNLIAFNHSEEKVMVGGVHYLALKVKDLTRGQDFVEAASAFYGAVGLDNLQKALG